MPTCKFVTVNVSSTNDSSFSIQEPEKIASESDVKHEYLSSTFVTNAEAIETLSNTTEFSTILENEPHKSTLPLKYVNKPSDKFKNELIDKNNILIKKHAEDYNTNIKYSSKVDHVYEEVNALECDIMDYYEKYSPTTAKTLINTLFLPRQKICKQCASLKDSPIYSDRLVYGKQLLYAREAHQFQQNDTVCFKYCPKNGKHGSTLFSQYDNNQHCLIVYNYLKTNASSIFYFYGQLQDIFDLKTALKPNILLINGDVKGSVNTELYHRCASNFYKRISNNGITPMTFHINHNNILNTIKHIGYNTDLQNWMNYRNDVFRSHSLKQDDVIEHRANRSSLLLLEPLLLMPELTSPRYRHGKNRISQSEHVKIIKIVIAYTLSFFILATVTFYIVYFT